MSDSGDCRINGTTPPKYVTNLNSITIGNDNIGNLSLQGKGDAPFIQKKNKQKWKHLMKILPSLLLREVCHRNSCGILDHFLSICSSESLMTFFSLSIFRKDSIADPRPNP